MWKNFAANDKLFFIYIMQLCKYTSKFSCKNISLSNTLHKRRPENNYQIWLYNYQIWLYDVLFVHFLLTRFYTRGYASLVKLYKIISKIDASEVPCCIFLYYHILLSTTYHFHLCTYY